MNALTLLLATVSHWSVPAMSEEQFLPDRDPVHGLAGGTVQIVAARDEYEPASFVVKSDRDLGKVAISVGTLVNEKGSVFPAENIDLKVVKVWYQNRNGWFSYFGDTGFKLCPELLLNDEDLIRVDTTKEANYAKLTDTEGKTIGEEWINAPRQMDKRDPTWYTTIKNVFQPMAPTFKDAKTLQPVTLEKDVRKQFFLTAHVTAAIPAGVYRGTITLRSTPTSNSYIYTIPVALRVLDFTLPRPKTYFNGDKDFIVSCFSYLSEDIIRELNGGDYELMWKQYRAILSDQVRHGMQVHWIRGGISPENDYLIRIMQEVGMRTDMILGGAYPKRSSTWNTGRGVSRADMVADAKEQVAHYDALLGHHNVYIGHGDEPNADWVVKERDLIDAYQEAGFKFIIASQRMLFHKAGHYYDFTSASKQAINDTVPRLWNQIGADKLVAWYGHKHIGPENPAMNRREYGLAAYLSGYSALLNYAYHLGPYNDDSTTYKPMVHAYGTYDGVLDTLQWEGFREGVDDIRYATLMTALARKARACGSRAAVREGSKALLFMAKLTMGPDDYFGTGADDLNAVRLEMIGYIERLRALLGNAAMYDEKPIGVKRIVAEMPPKPAKYNGQQAALRFGDWARAAQEADAFVAKKSFAGLGDIRMIREFALGYLMTGSREKGLSVLRETGKFPQVLAILEGRNPQWSKEPHVAIAEIETAGQFMLVLKDEVKVRELIAAKDAIARAKPRKTYVVPYSAHTLAGLGDWANASVQPAPQKLDRKFGGDMEFLVTDVISGDRGMGIGSAKNDKGEPATMRVICDRKGLHFRFDEKNADAADIENGIKNGGSFECYLAPGENTPYDAFMPDQGTGRMDLFSTTYDTHGLRSLPATGLRAARCETSFGDSTISTYVFVPWDSYATFIPKAGGEWEFEVAFWNKRGGECWNGLESIHGRSTWGRLRFELPESARATILKRLLYAARKSYEREKQTWDSGEGVLDHWKDADIGDAEFYAAKVKPLIAELDAYGKELDTLKTDAEILRFADKVLLKWRDVRFDVAELRRVWLLEKQLAKVPSNWTKDEFPAMTSPTMICVRKGVPFRYQMTYKGPHPYSLSAKGLGPNPLPAGLRFDPESGILSGALATDGDVWVTIMMNVDGRCVQWGDVKIRVYGTENPVPTLENEVVYQLQFPGFTEEGTFDAAASQFGRLKDLGITWVYLSPITTADRDTDRKYWSARQKASGMNNPVNPYRPADFMNAEPAYGGNAAFKRLVETAHKFGLKVMTDVVFLHAGPTALFLKDHPEWVCRDEKGEMVCAEWAFPRLNYKSASLRRHLKDSLAMWIRDYGVDGFRCDCGCDIPVDFWEEAKVEIDALKDNFVMLLEGTESRYGEKAFNAFYGFIASHNGIIEAMSGRKPATIVREQWEVEKAQGPAGIAWMRCTDTHDLANNDGKFRKESAFGRRACETGIALSFALDGFPMLWMGQEIGWDQPYSIFGKTVVDWKKPVDKQRAGVIKRLAALKREPAFGAQGDVIWQIPEDPDHQILFLRRAPDDTTYRCFFDFARGEWSIDKVGAIFSRDIK